MLESKYQNHCDSEDDCIAIMRKLLCVMMGNIGDINQKLTEMEAEYKKKYRCQNMSSDSVVEDNQSKQCYSCDNRFNCHYFISMN